MRSYGKNWIYKRTATYKERNTRCATEWDVRIDVNEYITVEEIVNNVKTYDGLLYVLVSGVERPDLQSMSNGKSTYGSSGNHVHLCIVLLQPCTRTEVLSNTRGGR